MFTSHAGHANAVSKGRFSGRGYKRQYLFVFSLAFNLGFCAYLAFHILTPHSPYRTLEERAQLYLQCLPPSAQADYRERINAQLGSLEDMQKQVQTERQAIVELLAGNSFDKAAMNHHFDTIRMTNQKINSVYTNALADEEASLTPEERAKSAAILAGFLKHGQASSQ